eukprot:TRINITY_DN61251_c0_g1_i1.p1 TRINITY_DN61251_c0_g1~~TRINITY_DN61251_c0_g1_i1.p1  ORF type:complete len:337 (+),score=102.73 TRINITY_DN61251_c0_g1_i1:81-1013(+)
MGKRKRMYTPLSGVHPGMSAGVWNLQAPTPEGKRQRTGLTENVFEMGLRRESSRIVAAREAMRRDEERKIAHKQEFKEARGRGQVLRRILQKRIRHRLKLRAGIDWNTESVAKSIIHYVGGIRGLIVGDIPGPPWSPTIATSINLHDLVVAGLSSSPQYLVAVTLIMQGGGGPEARFVCSVWFGRSEAAFETGTVLDGGKDDPLSKAVQNAMGICEMRSCIVKKKDGSMVDKRGGHFMVEAPQGTKNLVGYRRGSAGQPVEVISLLDDTEDEASDGSHESMQQTYGRVSRPVPLTFRPGCGPAADEPAEC